VKANHRAQSVRLPLPPGGVAVLDAVMNRRPTNTFIMAGPDAWNRHKIRTDKVVLPPNASPDEYDWGLFRGQEPTVIADDSDPERWGRLAWLLLRAGARTVCVVFEVDGITHCRHYRHE
jgi:hypothetical protein